MKREYNINEDEWELIFHAPLIDDGVDVVHGLVPTITTKSGVVTFGDPQGVYIDGTKGGNQAYDALRYTFPQNLCTLYANDKEFLATATIKYTYTKSVPLAGVTGWLPNNQCIASPAPRGGWGTILPFAIPYNTEYTFYNHIVHTASTRDGHTSNSINDTVVQDAGNIIPGTANRNFVVIGNTWASNNQYYVGHIRDFKIYR